MPRKKYAGWKTTATARAIHKPKGRFPQEAVCGVILVDDKSTRNLGPCNRCVASEARESRQK